MEKKKIGFCFDFFDSVDFCIFGNLGLVGVLERLSSVY
jgi:hypothetical protein